MACICTWWNFLVSREGCSPGFCSVRILCIPQLHCWSQGFSSFREVSPPLPCFWSDSRTVLPRRAPTPSCPIPIRLSSCYFRSRLDMTPAPNTTSCLRCYDNTLSTIGASKDVSPESTCDAFFFLFLHTAPVTLRGYLLTISVALYLEP